MKALSLRGMPISRRTWLRSSLTIIAGALHSSVPCMAQPAGADARLITPAAQAAIDKGLAFLVERQRTDGAMGTTSSSRRPAVAALAGIAWLASGSTPGRGPYGSNVARTADYIMSQIQESGFIVAPEFASHGPMYGHAFATLFLAEVYGMSQRTDIREALEKAVKLIADTQNVDGGWRYFPQSRDADTSVTVCQMMALRAARNAGLHVPAETVTRCVDYLMKCQNIDGGFRYMLEDGPSEFPRSAGAVVALFSAGVHDTPETERGIEYILQFKSRNEESLEYSHYFYGHYYAAQATWQAGGDRWRSWFPAIRDQLIQRQLPEGSWFDSYSSEYGTSMACIILQVPNDYLPIFQR